MFNYYHYLSQEITVGVQLFHCLSQEITVVFNYHICLSQEISELRDQLRDLMFFLEAKQTLASTTEATQQEIQDGQIIVQSPTASGHAGKKSRKKTR